MLRPLRTITAATRRISADNLHERLAVTGPADEVKDLADTIDELLERLEASFAAQRRFVANASHELRTPLATMRASLDVAVAKPEPVPAQTVALADRLRTELDQVDRLLEGFLVLARAQHGALADRAPVSLGRVVSAALDARAADIAAKSLTVDDGRPPTPRGRGAAATLLARMVDNVIDNAVIAQPRRRLDPGRRHADDDGGAARRGDRRAGPRPASRSRGWPSRSSGSAPTGPAPTTAPGSACRSSRPSPPRTAAASTCAPGPRAACGSPSRCRLATAPDGVAA